MRVLVVDAIAPEGLVYLREHGFEVVTLRSVGHTFDLDLLLERLSLYNRPIFGSMRWMAQRMRLGRIQIYVNPLTKMIAFARRRS